MQKHNLVQNNYNKSKLNNSNKKRKKPTRVSFRVKSDS